MRHSWPARFGPPAGAVSSMCTQRINGVQHCPRCAALFGEPCLAPLDWRGLSTPLRPRVAASSSPRVMSFSASGPTKGGPTASASNRRDVAQHGPQRRSWAWYIAESLTRESNPEAIPFVLGALRENIRDGHASLRRALLAQVLFALLFFVVIDVKAADATVLGFKVTDPSLIAKTIPVVVAYLVYDAFFSLFLLGRYRETLARIVPLFSADLGATNAHRLLYPPTPSFMAESFHFGGERRPRPSAELQPIVRVFDSLVWVGVYTVLLATVAFLVYAYVSLWRNFDGFSVLTVVSAVFTLFFVLRVAMLFRVVPRVLHEKPEADYPD